MRKVTAIMGWFVEVSIQVGDDETVEHIKERLANVATNELIKGHVLGPDVVESSDEDLIDK